MSVSDVMWAVEQECPTPTDKLVLIMLANFSTLDGVSWPTSATLGNRCGIAPSTALKSLRRLKDAGLIRITAKPRRIALNKSS